MFHFSVLIAVTMYPSALHNFAGPNQVSGVRFLPSDENTLSVEWNRPRSDAPIVHYEMRYRQQTGDPSWQGPVTATTEAVTLRSLVPSTLYVVQVRAVSRIGAGQYSSEVILGTVCIDTVIHIQAHVHTERHTAQMHSPICVVCSVIAIIMQFEGLFRAIYCNYPLLSTTTVSTAKHHI